MVTRRCLAGLPAGLVAAAVLLVTGCTSGVPMAPSPPQPTATPSPADRTPSGWPSSKPPLYTAPPSPEPQDAQLSPARWQAILDDLAGRGVAGTPELQSAHAVTWPDSSLGCPSPGVFYTQALVDGVRALVTAQGQRYDYRFGNGDEPKLCTSGR